MAYSWNVQPSNGGRVTYSRHRRPPERTRNRTQRRWRFRRRAAHRGGVSSFIAATVAPHVTRRLGSGATMILGLGVFGLSLSFIPLAKGATFLSALLLVAQQLGDGFCVLYEINQATLRQTLASERMLGRVNSTFQFLNLGATLIGSLIAGLLGGMLGVRLVLVLGCCCALLAVIVLATSPLRKFETGDSCCP